MYTQVYYVSKNFIQRSFCTSKTVDTATGLLNTLTLKLKDVAKIVA